MRAIGPLSTALRIELCAVLRAHAGVEALWLGHSPAAPVAAAAVVPAARRRLSRLAAGVFAGAVDGASRGEDGVLVLLVDEDEAVVTLGVGPGVHLLALVSPGVLGSGEIQALCRLAERLEACFVVWHGRLLRGGRVPPC